MRLLIGLTVFFSGSFAATVAKADQCRQALVLALDVSLSVDGSDFQLQREGLARALLDRDVVRAMTSGGAGHVELAIFEWSGSYDQKVLVAWVIIEDRATLEQIAGVLRAGRQTMRSGRTAIGASMRFARDLLREKAHCGVRTLDISGDGMNNNGPLPQDVKAEMERAGIIVNALVIGQRRGEVFFGEPDAFTLSRYFLDHVIVGPAAFVETVLGFEGYSDAIRRKLLRELSPAHVRHGAPDRVRVARR